MNNNYTLYENMDHEMKVEYISKILSTTQYDFNFTKTCCIDDIYDILNGNIKDNYDYSDGHRELYCAIFYDINKDKIKQKEYLFKAVEKKNMIAINVYGIILSNENISEAKKYFQIAISCGNKSAMYNYAIILQYNEKNISEAKIYYQMAMKCGSIVSYLQYARLIEGDDNEDALKLYWKYHKLRKEKDNSYNDLTDIRRLLNGNDKLIVELFLENDSIDNLRNFQKCLKDHGPLESMINSYL